jgi:predicted amidohydrolase YtcJ
MDANGVDDQGEPFIAEDRIDLATAIAAFTINAAFVNKQEDETGSIEVGKYADLAVLDQNLFEIDAADISATNVLLTLLEGRVVHGDLDAVGTP